MPNGTASLDTMPKYVSSPLPSGVLSGRLGNTKVGGLSFASLTSTTTVTEENPVPVLDVVGTEIQNVFIKHPFECPVLCKKLRHCQSLSGMVLLRPKLAPLIKMLSDIL